MTAYEPGPAEAFEAEWERCAPWIEAALEHAKGAFGLQHVKERIASGAARLWTGPKSACVTVLTDHPNFRSLNIWLAGGDLEELRDQTLPAMEAYGRENCCRLVTISGRKGWARALGYEPIHVVCCKEL